MSARAIEHLTPVEVREETISLMFPGNSKRDKAGRAYFNPYNPKDFYDMLIEHEITVDKVYDDWVTSNKFGKHQFSRTELTEAFALTLLSILREKNEE